MLTNSLWWEHVGLKCLEAWVEKMEKFKNKFENVKKGKILKKTNPIVNEGLLSNWKSLVTCCFFYHFGNNRIVNYHFFNLYLKTIKKDYWWREISRLPWLHPLAAGKPWYRKTSLFVHQLWCQHEVSVYSNKESHRDIFINSLSKILLKF